MSKYSIYLLSQMSKIYVEIQNLSLEYINFFFKKGKNKPGIPWPECGYSSEWGLRHHLSAISCLSFSVYSAHPIDIHSAYPYFTLKKHHCWWGGARVCNSMQNPPEARSHRAYTQEKVKYVCLDLCPNGSNPHQCLPDLDKNHLALSERKETSDRKSVV